MTAPYDLLFEHGTVVDGSGDPGFAASVGVRDGRLEIIRHGTAREVPSARRIDASGLVVAPGFIDLHSHSGLMILAEPLHEPKIRQGVTTEVIGVDGLTYAPFRSRADLPALIDMNAGLDGAPAERDARLGRRVETYLGRFDAPAVSQRRAAGRQLRAAHRRHRLGRT